MNDKQDIIYKLIDNIELPITNNYYEKNSADGYAFLGYALKKIGSNKNLLDELKIRNFSLNSEYKILTTNTTKNNQYTYTLWICIEYLSLLNEKNLLDDLYKIINDIGVYDNGMARYCNEEVNFIVPNVSTAMALIHCRYKNFNKAKELIDIIREKQLKNGNWKYSTNKPIKKLEIKKEEDIYHHCMMIYHLMEIKKYNILEVDDIIEKSLKLYENYKNINEIKNNGKSGINWFYPMFMLIIKDKNKKLFDQTLELVINKYIFDKNFRVRSICAWALSQIFF
jgi:hypothetical protein